MSLSFARRLDAVAPSATLAMAAEAARLRAEGHKVISFSVGEPDFPTPAHIREAAKQALDRGASHYTAVSGTPDVKAAICDATEKYRGFRPMPAQVTVSVGVKHALFNLATALYEPGDEVIIPAPYWVSYPEQVRLVGAEPVIVQTTEEAGFRMTPAQLAAALGPRTKAVILCTPSNPTGAAYSGEELRALIDVVRGHDSYLIVDEIYADLVYDGFAHVSAGAIAPDLQDRLIVLDGVSKTYAMTGWRIGWSITSPALAKALDTVQGQSTSNATAVAQAAAAAALRGPRDEVIRMRDIFARRRAAMVNGLRAIDPIRCRMPEGAFYAFADVRGLYGRTTRDGALLASDIDVAQWFLKAAHVAGVPGTPFGAPGYLRCSYACSEDEIAEGLARIGALVASAAAV